MRIKISVAWRTIDEQGPQNDPTISEDVLFYDRPILLSEISRVVRDRYGGLVDNITIIEIT